MQLHSLGDLRKRYIEVVDCGIVWRKLLDKLFGMIYMVEKFSKAIGMFASMMWCCDKNYSLHRGEDSGTVLLMDP